MESHSSTNMTSLSAMQGESISSNVAERIKLHPRRARNTDQPFASNSVASQTVVNHTVVNQTVATEPTVPSPSIASRSGAVEPITPSVPASVPLRSLADKDRIFAALKKYLARPVTPESEEEQPNGEESEEETEAPGFEAEEEEEVEDTLLENDRESSIKPSIEIEENITSNSEDEILVQLEFKVPALKRSSTSSTSPPKRLKSTKVIKHIKKAIKTPTKATKFKTPTPPQESPSPVPKQSSSPQAFAHYKMTQNDKQPSVYHVGQEYMLKQEEVIALRPAVDRQALTAIFEAKYKLHPFCRPFVFTKREHAKWWKMVVEERNAVKKENVNMMKREGADSFKVEPVEA